jgi:signal transduction histidine kinase/CheY-like chemotaxis protein
MYTCKSLAQVEDYAQHPSVANDPHLRFYCGVPLKTPDGIAIGALAVMDTKERDITDKQIQMLWKLSRQVVTQLELRLKINSLKNAEAELVKHNDSLTTLNKEKSEFFGVISHDIRQPLSAIMMTTELILQDEEHSVCTEHENLLQTAYSSSLFMQNLVDNMLILSKIDIEKMPAQISSRSMDIIPLFGHIVTTNRILMKRKNISLSLEDRAGRRVICKIDANRLEQVLNNLLTNAYKFSNPGTKVSVIVSCNKNFAQILVQDQGLGIPAHEIQNLFQSSKKISVRPTGGETSTGLGLAIAKNIIIAHGGDIQVRSTVNVGTTFIITLPMQPNEDIIELIVPLPVIKSPGAKKSLRVLIAEDNTVNQKLLSQVITNLGHQTMIANDGQEAMDLLQKIGTVNFDILLIDDEMPHVKGVDVIRSVRKANTKIPIISISGNVTEEDKKKVIDAGATYCCSKPFKIQNLIDIIQEYAKIV